MAAAVGVDAGLGNVARHKGRVAPDASVGLPHAVSPPMRLYRYSSSAFRYGLGLFIDD